MGKLIKNGRIYGGHSTTAATVTYTDTNNIGATDVQGAIDVFGTYTTGRATVNATYVNPNNGFVTYQKFGKLVMVNAAGIKFDSMPPYGSWTYTFASGLPKARTDMPDVVLLLLSDNPSSAPVRVALGGGGTALFFHWTVTTAQPGEFNSTFTYICE